MSKAIYTSWLQAISAPYQVHFGLYQGKVEGFATFAEALAFYIEHLADGGSVAWCAPSIVGAGHDESSDGLTEDERHAVELASEVAA